MAQLFHIPCLLYFGVLGGTPDPENFCQKVYWATLLYKQKQFADRVQDFLIESESIRQSLMEMANEYWAKPDEENALVKFVKKCSSHGTSLYDIYLRQQKVEKEQADKKMLRQKEQLEHFKEITRKSYYNDYNNSFQLY